MAVERILITVRTYPNLSKKYFETVCTGGINDQGEWRRLYPVSIRQLDSEKQYKTFDVISVDLGMNPDGRPESRRPDPVTIQVQKRLNDDQSRADWILPTAVESLEALKAAERTLGPVRVRQVREFNATPIESEWTPEEQQILAQSNMFEDTDPLEKIPFRFRLLWTDEGGTDHDSLFLAWEVGQTWRRLRSTDDPIGEMRRRWMTDRFGPSHDVWFFMGNYAGHRQHFGVCGTFTPRKGSYSLGSLFTDPR